MNLAIDVGNTLVKFGVFASGKMEFKEKVQKDAFAETLKNLSKTFPAINNVIVASVGRLSAYQISLLEDLYPVLTLTSRSKLPFKNNYGTPQTLGVDRIALVAAAAHQFPGQNVLIIDAGTCITYDFLTMEKEYLGGAIAPGILMRYQSLHNYTAKLPLLEIKTPESLVGTDTETSLHSGVVNGILFEMDGFIDAYKNKFGNLTVILTGGDAHFLRASIKNDIFANPNFLLEGLNHILEFNIP